MRSNLFYIIIGGVLVIVVFILSAILFLNTNSSPQTQGQPTPTLSQTNLVPTVSALIIPANAIPHLPNSNAVDTTSTLVQTSQIEIQRITPFLPYVNDFTSTVGEQVSIVIPETQFQADPWKLQVNMNDINFQVLPSEPTYTREQTSFLEASNKLFSWIRSNGADPEKIIFTWGDPAFMQQRAEQW